MPLTVELKSVPVGSQFTLDTKFKEHPPGTVLTLEALQDVQGKWMAMVTAVPGARPFCVPAEKLTLVAGETPAAADEPNELETPVGEFFVAHTGLESDIAIQLMADYIETLGDDDVSYMDGWMDAVGALAGQTWTPEQTAGVAKEFYEAMGQDVPDAVTEALKPKPVPKAAPVEEKKAVGRPAKASAPTTTATVDKESWSGTHAGALNIMGALAPFFAESPGNFTVELELAVKMLNAANKVK